MEFDHLKGFYYVAKLGSFTEAAGRLYLTQPAISLQVKALEEELGERLFDRVGRRIRLTHAGGVLYRQVEDLIGRLEEIHRTVGELKSLDCGRLCLGASDTTSIYFLPELLKAFSRTHPRVDLGIRSLISTQVVERVKDRDCDLGIVTLSELPPCLQAVPLYQQRFTCIMASGHSLAARKSLELREIAAEPLISLEKESITRQRIDAHLLAAQLSARPVMELSSFEVVKRYVAAGLGVSIAPEAVVSDGRDGVCAVPFRPALSMDVGIVFRSDRKLPRTALAFLDMAQAFFKDPAARQGVLARSPVVAQPQRVACERTLS